MMTSCTMLNLVFLAPSLAVFYPLRSWSISEFSNNSFNKLEFPSGINFLTLAPIMASTSCRTRSSLARFSSIWAFWSSRSTSSSSLLLPHQPYWNWWHCDPPKLAPNPTLLYPLAWAILWGMCRMKRGAISPFSAYHHTLGIIHPGNDIQFRMYRVGQSHLWILLVQGFCETTRIEIKRSE